MIPALAEMTDNELLEQFSAATLPPEYFHHAQHVRVAFLYLCRYPVLEALEKFCLGLKHFAAALGKPQRYHETVTWSYVFLIHERMARAGQAQTWEEFARQNPDLFTWKNGVLQRYYTGATLSSDLARRVFVFPDQQPCR
jgi:hypothetical protein